jgi:gamma-glutamyltranspeptidase/glutathione hydrolase
MAPTIVFDDKGNPVLAGGSAGGGPIVDYIATGLIEILANDRTPAAALSQPRITTAVPGKVQIERGSSLVKATPALTAKGHALEEAALISGAGFIRRTPQGWIGAADPRRDGTAR